MVTVNDMNITMYLLSSRREALIRTYPFASALERKKGIKSMFAKRRKKKIFYQSTPPSTSLGIGDEVPTYEDVVKLEPSPDLIRPLVLIGAPGVGRRTLIRKLLNTNTSRYLPVIQCRLSKTLFLSAKSNKFSGTV